MDKTATYGYNHSHASWGSIIAGVVTVLAVGLLLSTLGTALSFSVIHPLSDHPTSGLKTTFGLWSAIEIIVSLACGGYISGRLAKRDGMIHGFLVWGLAFILSVILGGMMISSAFNSVKNVASNTLSAASSMASDIGASLSENIDDIKDNLSNNFDLSIDGDKARDDIEQLLRDTEVPTLQPNYLQQQLNAAQQDIRVAFRQLVNNPQEYDNIFKGLTDKISHRVNGITSNVDKNAAINALAKNRNISRDEATQIVNNLINNFNYSVAKAKEQLDNVQMQVNQFKDETQQLIQETRKQADKATKAIAKSALFMFISLLIGALVSAAFGYLGTRNRFNF
jgi:VIT1/CCC1 family predicted Fe2+/Mn2+ transporter